MMVNTAARAQVDERASPEVFAEYRAPHKEEYARDYGGYHQKAHDTQRDSRAATARVTSDAVKQTQLDIRTGRGALHRMVRRFAWLEALSARA